MVEGKVKVGDKYLVPAGTELWFINLQLKLVTTRELVIEVTHTIAFNDTGFFGELYDVIFKHTIPGLIKVPNGETSCDLSIVEPLGDTLKPKFLTAKYESEIQ